MDRRHLCFTALLLHFIFMSQIFCDSSLSKSRHALEIIIGIPGYTSPSPPSESPDCPPPPPSPPPPCPPPSPPPHPPISPPPHPPSPPPLFFDSKRLEIVYNVIQDFKKQITHDPFGITKTWVGSNICKDYKGFYCGIVPDYNVTALAAVDFNGYQFSGPSIAGFIDMLPDLAFFHANTNNFTGEIPKGIAKLRYFYELDLSNNAYSGTIPQAVFGATNLTFLDLRFNKFSGLLPPQVFFLGTDVLFVNNNNLMQRLPDNLGSTQARYLTLANNKFTGSIPSSIGDASQLVEVLLLNNQLTGCLPYEIGWLGNVTLFDAGQNKLSGPIPHSFACLGRIEILNLAQNELYGPVPELVCKLAHLMNLSLSYNYFTSVGPICRYLMMKNVLDVRMNCIVGVPGQRSPAECHAFFSKPKCCTSDEKTYSWIPCGKYNGKPAARAGNAATHKSYATLIPHKL